MAAVRGGPDATVVLEALTRHIQPALIDAVLHQTDRCRRRRRQLPAPMMVWRVIAIGLWGDLDIPAIWRQVMGTLRSLWRVAAGRSLPTQSALSQARQRLGARPIRQLFVHTAAPWAATDTRGAFYRGMRRMAIDGGELALPDTPANRKAFGRPGTRRHGQPVAGGDPKVQVLRLMEVGTHWSLEALIRPPHHGEYPVAPRPCCTRPQSVA